MKTIELHIPNLPRLDNDPEVNDFLTGLVVTYHVAIRLEDEPDEDGNCVIQVTSGDPAVLESLRLEIETR